MTFTVYFYTKCVLNRDILVKMTCIELEFSLMKYYVSINFMCLVQIENIIMSIDFLISYLINN